ncbi:tetratricopeptide repeat protein [Nocardia inohanensis]|uniref:tetratricopeptide repeat protein n=1 Tax=Nocardia inohanensis TaxID=209246 RepID=UPI000835FB16|nr:tetratricopeptide repeat protein [Nocardia inohanensis]
MTADYYDLGTYARPVTTASDTARLWFDRGLIWSYAFNHEEAVRCFRQAVAADPGFAMAYWGVAYALGPNYNKPWEFFDAIELADTVADTHEAVRKAVGLADSATPVERALIQALAARYPRATPEADGSLWNLSYAEAMRLVYKRFPDDLDVAALCAEALMNLTPWALWDQRSGEPAAGAHTLEAKAILDQALKTEAGRAHPGLLHLYIHLMEMSGTPESALAVADRLRGLVPDAGHLAHMPSHLDVLCGDYRGVVAANSAAIAADEKFVRRAGGINFYTLYRAHNYHFKIYGAMFLGQSATALETVARLEQSIPEELLRVQSPPMADWLESFLSMRVHAFIRFGKWAEIIELPLPADPELYCVTTAMLHYAKGVAYSATGRVAEAEAEQLRFHAAVAAVPESRTLFNNTCRDILAIAAAMLDGELLYRKGEYDRAFDALRRSIELDDNLPYDEPWGWMQPTRHAYGALLLEQGRVAEAEAVYRADLGLDHTLPRAAQHPGNVWSLHGYHECLVRLGKTEAAEIIAQQLKLAAAVADVPIEASCYCRLEPDHCCH